MEDNDSETVEPTDQHGSTGTDETPDLPFEASIESSFRTYGLGRLTGDLPDDYQSARLNVEYLESIIETAEMFGWSEVRLSIMDDYPITIRNADGDDAPTLLVAPILDGPTNGGL